MRTAPSVIFFITATVCMAAAVALVIQGESPWLSLAGGFFSLSLLYKALRKEEN